MCIAWTRYVRRPDLLAQHLGTQAVFISHGQSGKLLQAPFRYITQTRETWRRLMQEQPDVVLIQAPPNFVPLIIMLYAKRTGARYIIDAHSGAFVSPKWQWSIPLLRLAARGALTTIVTNDHLKALVESWGAHASIIAFTPGRYPPGEPYAFQPQEALKIVVVSTFEIDEPLDEVFKAARQMPDVGFYITGDPARAPAQLIAQKPDNCHLTGFIPYPQYVGLLRDGDAILDLTTVDHTLLMGAFEAVSLGTPLIVSDWPILRSYFGKAAICIPNTAQGVIDGVTEFRRNPQQHRDRVAQLRDDLNAEWNQRFRELQDLIEQKPSSRMPSGSMQAAKTL